jgi:Flp pilus assembly protein TadG
VALKGFARNRRGAAAVEFALLMIPFITLALGAVQTAVVFFMDQVLQTAAKQASRQLMIGAAQSAGMTQAQFVRSVCGYASSFSCANLMVDVESGTDFSSLSTAPLTISYNAQGAPTNAWSYSPGNPGDTVILRVMYDWPIFGGPFAPFLVNQSNGTRLLVATVVWKNEPFVAGGG